ncbi:MAG: sn-glycerol-3-phosphate ABC transporter ATP-binding protein UgpC [Candidatus Sericytochromatia bacterium]|nr:sn-glycerol-3-phosphate ABC transporter ATP-binding protein UgpC [Candidatus Sericytochromatia bacterium]
MARVKFDHVIKRYGDNLVIKGLDLEIADREFLVLVGPSGCGKSTALRMIAGLEEISEGNLYIGDRVVNDVPPKNRDIAMVFQNYALYPHMSVRENMGFALKLRNTPKSEIDRVVDDVAARLEIQHLLERKPKQLSGGQRQRVALGRAIVRNPQVFLMDEPLSNLDAKLRVSMRAEIKKLHRDLQTTFVYVTHDQTEALTMGDRIAIFNAGHMQQVGTPAEVYQRPANLFVATFIGSPQMNLVRGVAATVDGRVHLRGENFAFTLPEGRNVREGDVVVGFRPEHLVPIAAELPGYRAEVDVVEPMGSEGFVYLRGTGAPVVARLEDSELPQVGDVLSLGVDPTKLHLFDPVSEARLL